MARITYLLDVFFFFSFPFGTIVCLSEVCNPAAEPADCTLQEVKGPEKREEQEGEVILRSEGVRHCKTLRLCCVAARGPADRVDGFMFACICTSLGG